MKFHLAVAVMFYLSLVLYTGCSPEKPLVPESSGHYSLVVMDKTGSYNVADTAAARPVPDVRVTLYSPEYDHQYSYVTNEKGVADITGIIAARYDIHAVVSLSNSLQLIGGKSVEIYAGHSVTDTVFLEIAPVSKILINEINYAGPVNQYHFFYDQFVELYNRSTNDTCYLDGKIIGRLHSSEYLKPVKDALSYVELQYAFQFPGNPGEKNYPIYPGQHVVIAGDAADHSKTVPTAVNLENADWEFCNQAGNDFDNPNVPNLRNIILSQPRDFMINMISDGIIFSDGTKWQVITNSNGSDYVHVPIETVIDGVEYRSGSDASKYLTVKVDAGLAGAGLPRYSGMSVERVDPTVDTNNSTFDFHNLSAPSPGYQGQ